MSKKMRVTPFATVKWAHLFEPRPGFKPTDAPKYEVTLVFDPSDTAWGELIETWAEEVTKAKGKNSNVKPELDKAGGMTGMQQVSFKTGAPFPPKVLDIKGSPIAPCKIANGSVARVAYTTKPYIGLGGGVTLYLSSVQISELEVYEDNPFAADLPF